MFFNNKQYEMNLFFGSEQRQAITETGYSRISFAELPRFRCATAGRTSGRFNPEASEQKILQAVPQYKLITILLAAQRSQ
jgi:hypothetical protein